MNTLGDYQYNFMGDGLETNPSQAFGYEPNTGIYRDTSGSSTAFTISKRGVKRFYIDDTKTEVIGTFVADGIAPTGNVSIEDGSASSPGLNFQSSTNTGLYKEGTGIAFAINGNKRFKIDNTLITAATSITAGSNSIASSQFISGGNTLNNTGLTAGTVGVGIAVVLAGGASIQNHLNVPILSETGALAASSIVDSGSLSVTGTSSLGAVTSSSIVNTGTINSSGTITGVNANFSGSLSSQSFSNSGTLSQTGSSTFGSMTTGAITSGGDFTNSPHNLTTVTLNSNNISNGANILTDTLNIVTSETLGTGSAILNHSGISLLSESGALTSTSITNSGTLSSGAITTSGTLNAGSNSITTTGTITGGSLTAIVANVTGDIEGSGTNPLIVSSTTNNYGLTVHGPLVSGAITSSGATFSGAVTQPRTWIRQTITSNQSTTSGTAQFVSWDSTAATGGSSSNWTFASGANIVTPSSGMYLLTVSVSWASTSTSSKGIWIEINSSTAGSTRLWAFTDISLGSALSSGASQVTSLLYYATVGDFFSVGVKQANGTAVNILTPGTDVEVVKLFE